MLFLSSDETIQEHLFINIKKNLPNFYFKCQIIFINSLSNPISRSYFTLTNTRLNLAIKLSSMATSSARNNIKQPLIDRPNQISSYNTQHPSVYKSIQSKNGINKRVHWQGDVSGSGLEWLSASRRTTAPPPLRSHLAICHLTYNEPVHLNPASTHHGITSTSPFVNRASCFSLFLSQQHVRSRPHWALLKKRFAE